MTKKYSAPAVARLLDIIEFLAAEDKGFSINEMARNLNIPVNTVYRICMEMEERSYLDKSDNTGLYQLGSRFFHIGQVVGSRIDLRTKAIPILKSLRDQLGETAHLCILQKEWMVLLDQVETEQHIRIHVEPGTLMYPHASAFGKCLMAYASEDIVDKILDEELVSLTQNTTTVKEKLHKELSEIRDKGWTFDLEEYMEGVRCVGAPIHGCDRKGIASIGIVGPAYRLSEERMKESIPLVKEAANKLSGAMGYI